MNKDLKTATDVLACLFLIPALASAGTITIILDAITPPSGVIAPNTAGVVLGAWDILAPNAEALRVVDVSVGLHTTGTVFVQNLRLFENGVLAAPPIGVPWATDTFSINVMLPAGFEDIFTVLADIGAPGNGTVQLSFLANGVAGVGQSTFEAYTGPSQTVFANLQQVGAGNPAPEPGTLVTMFVSTIVGLAFLRRRRLA